MSDSETSYRWSVIPLGVFFVIGGIVFPIFAWIIPVPITNPAPFVRSEDLNRNIFGTGGIICLLIGLGLLLRWRVGWYLLLAYLGIAIIGPFIAAFDPETTRRMGKYFWIVGLVFNLLTSIGIVIVTLPAFQSPSISRKDQS